MDIFIPEDKIKDIAKKVKIQFEKDDRQITIAETEILVRRWLRRSIDVIAEDGEWFAFDVNSNISSEFWDTAKEEFGVY